MNSILSSIKTPIGIITAGKGGDTIVKEIYKKIIKKKRIIVFRTQIIIFLKKQLNQIYSKKPSFS